MVVLYHFIISLYNNSHNVSYIIVGLGNPGVEYEKTRHNAGRLVLAALKKSENWQGATLPEWKFDKKLNALVSEGKIGAGKKAQEVKLVLPETMMNNSGKAVGPLIKTKKAAEKLIVVYDDLDLPLGTMKVSWNRGDGGHRGLASVIKAVKTREFTRVRIGISPVTPSGKIKKPNTEDKILKFIIGPFKGDELKAFKKVSKRAVEALVMIVTEGREKGMNI